MQLREIGNTIRAIPLGFIDRYGRDLAVFLISSLIFGTIASLVVYRHLSGEPADLTLIRSAELTSVPTITSALTVTPEPSQSIVSTPNNISNSKININSATLAELDTLPGIGPAYAQRIIDARPFSSISSIVRVSGIGPKTYENIRDMITVE